MEFGYTPSDCYRNTISSKTYGTSKYLFLKGQTIFDLFTYALISSQYV